MRLVMIGLCFVLAGCELTARERLYETDLVVTTRIIAKTRRLEVIAEIERLQVVLRRTRIIDNRVALLAAINAYQVELGRLNLIIGD